MDPRNSIGQSVASVLTSIKTKGSEALGTTARFLQWSITPFKIFGNYLIGRSSSDNAQETSPSTEQATPLNTRRIDISDENGVIEMEPINNTPIAMEDIARAAIRPKKGETPEEIQELSAQYRKQKTKELDKIFSELLPRLPNVSLKDSRKALRAYYEFVMLHENPLPLPIGNKARTGIFELEKHFDKIGQFKDYENERDNQLRNIAHDIRSALTSKEFDKFMKTVAYDDIRLSLSHKTCQRRIYWQHTMEKVICGLYLRDPVVTGHKQERIYAGDVEFVQKHGETLKCSEEAKKLLQGLKVAAANVNLAMKSLPDSFQNFDVGAAIEDLDAYGQLLHTLSAQEQNQSLVFQKLKARCKVHREIIAQGRAALLEIQQKEGLQWDLTVLARKMSKERSCSKENTLKFNKLLEIKPLQGEMIDLAQLDWMIAKNNRGHNPMNVAIEGSGPTALMLALTQFASGANVSLIEKQSSEYERRQIIRLDPVWMAQLEFYLGQKFRDLFGEKGRPGKGTIRSDGYGEIAIHRLQEALSLRVEELMARHDKLSSKSGEPQKNKVERFADYEMTSVEDSEGGYIVKAKDVLKPEAAISRPVDMVICASDDKSPIRKQYFKDKTVKGTGNYGICSWEGSKEQPITNDRLKTFSDFRRVVVFDQQFQTSFQEEMKSQIDAIEGLDDDEKQCLKEQTGEQSASVLKLKKSTLGRAMQTQCTENKNQISIGMTLPEEFTQFCQKVQKQLAAVPVREIDQNFELRSKSDKKKWRDQRAADVQKALTKAWFQTVARSYGIDQSMGVTQDKIHDSSVAVFPAQQHGVKKNVIEKSAGSHKVLITAAGDAATTRHFMSGSGWTGAREGVQHLEWFTNEWTGDVSFKRWPSELKHSNAGLPGALERRLQKTEDYVITQQRARERGPNYKGSGLFDLFFWGTTSSAPTRYKPPFLH